LLTIDRFEGEYAVCETENGSMTNILISKIKGVPKEGDGICESENGEYEIYENPRKARISSLFSKIKEKNGK